MPRLLTKGLAAPAKAAPKRAVKLAPEGIVTAIVAVTGVVDAVEDLIVPGAFAVTLKKRRPKVVDDHEWGRKAGRVLHVEEWMPGDSRLPKHTKDGQPWPAEAGALVATMQYNLSSQAGRESYEWVRFYAESNEAEFSIGYKVPDGMARKRGDGVRIILQVDLFEFSHVLFGAAPLSMALEVKSLDGASGGMVARPALTGDDEDDEYDEKNADPNTPWDEDDDMQVKSAAALVKAAARPTPRRMETKSMETKSYGRMKGSYEERIEALSRAAEDLLKVSMPELCVVCAVATYDSEVVVTAYPNSDQPSSWLIPYQVDPTTGDVSLGEPSKVELSLVAVPGEDGPVYEGADDVEQYTVAAPMVGALDTAAALSKTEGKVAETIRAKVEAAFGLSAKSADEPIDPREPGDDEGDAEDTADAPPAADDDPADYPVDDEPADELEDDIEGKSALDREPADDPADTDEDDEGDETVTFDPDEHFKAMEELDADEDDDLLD